MLQARLLRPWFSILFAGLLGLAASAPAEAQGVRPERRAANPFTVSGVPVDASAESAAAARPIAIAEGQRRAFTQLLRRLTLPEDHGRLPRPSEAVLNQSVAGFEIDEERTSPTRYIGRITVSFYPDMIRRLLQDARLPYSETQSRPVLVIPVWQAPSGDRLWEADNPWREAWLRRPEGSGLVPLSIAPAREDGPPLDRLLGNPDELRTFARKLGFEDVLVVPATLQQQELGNIRIEIYPYHDGSATFLDSLERFVMTGGTQEEVLTNAAMDMTRRIEARWKAATVIDLEKHSQLSAAALFGGLAEWTTLRNSLNGVPGLRKVEVQRLSHRDAQLLIEFYGDPDQLAVALAQRDIMLEQRDGFWQLRSRKQ